MVNATSYLELAAEYGYTGGETARRLERIRCEYAALEECSALEEEDRRRRELAIVGNENHTDVNLLAGPFCHCRDYSCPGPVGVCVNY